MEEITADPQKHILWAAEHNKMTEAKELLKKDPNLVNATDDDLYTPLHRASYNGHVTMVKFLLESNANINAKTEDGWQPFHSACRWNNVDAAKVLIDQGADINCRTNGNNTALHLAAANGEAEDIIKFMLKNTQIDRTVINDGNDTAEDIARRNSDFGKYFDSVSTVKTGISGDAGPQLDLRTGEIHKIQYFPLFKLFSYNSWLVRNSSYKQIVQLNLE